MLQIKNTLGGGKPEGLYAWKKSSVTRIDSITTKAGTNYTLGTATSDTTVYYSTSYTFDEATGIYTLVNPQSANLAYNGSGGVATVSMEKSTYYIWGSTSSDKIYTTNDGSTYNVGIRNVGGSVYLESTAANEKYDVHSAKAEYIFLDYIVSDKETAYPDGGEKGGYWYERVSDGITPEMFGCTKMAVDTFTLSSTLLCSAHSISHSLGAIPKFMFIIAEKKPTAYYNVYQVLSTNPALSTEISSTLICYYSSGSYNSDTVGINEISSNQFKVNNSTFKYAAGIEYTVITMV